MHDSIPDNVPDPEPDTDNAEICLNCSLPICNENANGCEWRLFTEAEAIAEKKRIDLKNRKRAYYLAVGKVRYEAKKQNYGNNNS